MKTEITKCREDIGEVRAKLDALADKALAENRSFTPEEKTEREKLKKQLEALEERFELLEEKEARAKEAAKLAGAEAGAKEDAKDLKRFSLMRGLQLMAEGKPLDGVEAEVHQMASEEARKSGINIAGFAVPAHLGNKIEERGQSATGQTSNPGDQGGVTIQTEIGSMIEALWASSFLSSVGARRLSGLVGNQSFPVQLDKPAAQERTEIQALTDTEILFGKVDMAPNRRGITIPVSKPLLLQSSIDVQKFVIDQIVKGLDYKLNADAITAILAAITGTNLLALGTNGAAPTYANIVGLETILGAADADKGAIKYLTNTKVRGKLKTTEKFAGSNGQPVWEAGNELNGYPSVVSNIVPSNLTKGSASGICSAIVIGNFADCYVGMWGGTDFVVDPYTLAKNGQVQITANMFWDVEVARAASFAGIKDALTT